MANNFDKCIQLLIVSEGGYSNHKNDPGGKTKYGVTEKTWLSYNEKLLSGSELDISKISKQMAEKVYKKEYWGRIRADFIPVGVDYCVFDASVHHGVKTALKWLQQCLGVNEDGVIGPETLKAAEYCLPREVIKEFSTIRLIFCRSLNNTDFEKGWEKRIDRVYNDSMAMIK